MIFDEYLTIAEQQRWILDADVAWNSIEPAVALAQTDLLDQVRDSALIESYFPVFTTRLIRALWDHVDATAVFSVQLYESYKHFYVLNRYLEIIDYRPITEEEIVAIRRRNIDHTVKDAVSELARYMISEHFAAYFFMRLSRQANEKVLRKITAFIANDEFRHTKFAYDLLQQRIRMDATCRERILDAGIHFRHVGADVVGEVPVSEKNDFQAILTLNKRMQLLCGVSLSKFAEGEIRAGY